LNLKLAINQSKTEKVTRITLMVVLVVFAGWITYISLQISKNYGGTDLRARVVGARAMAMGKSPYFYKWNPADGERLLDPNDQPQRIVNGNIATPAVLLLMQPFNGLPYPSTRLVWTLLELLAVAFTFILLTRAEPNAARRLWMVIPALLLIVASPFFFLHTDRGQLYLFYPAVIAGAFYLFSKKGKGVFFSGMLIGLLVFFRPFTVFVAAGFLLKKEGKWLAGFGGGLVAGLLIFMLPMPETWTDYFSAMKIYSLETEAPQLLKEFTQFSAPTEIEGATNLSRWGQYNVTALRNVYEMASLKHLELSTTLATGAAVLFFSILSVLFYKRGQKKPAEIFVFGVILMICCEYFIKAPRGPYNILQWMIPAVFISQYFTKYQPLVGFLLFGLMGSIFYTVIPFFTGRQYLAELIIVLVSIWFVLKPERKDF